MLDRLAIYFGVVLLSLGMYSCNSGDNVNTKESLIGRWNVYASEINNKQSRNLENAWFHFKEDGQVDSNIFEDKTSHNYEVRGKNLTIHTQEPLKFEILKIKEDSLELEGFIKVFYMKFYLSKSQMQ